MNTLHTSSNAVAKPFTTRALKTPFSPRLKLALASGLVVLAAGLAPMAQALASTDTPGQHHAQHEGQRHGKHAMHGGMHGGMRGDMGMDMDMAGLGLGHGRHAERLLDSVGATPEQKAQIRQIGEAARADLRAQRQAGAGLREQARALMTQPEIDAQAVEALRQQMLAQHDQASQRMSRAMVDMARVLTPDQRQALAERMTERRAKRQQMKHKRQADQRSDS